jgi:hypothetical protein
MLPEHSQQLLRAARSGKLYKPPAPLEEDNEMKDEEEESKEIRTGFTIKKYVKVARHLEGPEPEYLAKRRKGLPSPYVSAQVTQPALRETKVKKLDAEGNVAVYKVLVPEGQSVEGEVQPTDAAIEVAPATAAPGTIVEGIGVVNAEGIVVASDIMQQTPPRRRPPPPKKVKRGGPGRGKKKVVFAEGAAEQGTPASTAGGDMLEIAGIKREDGSVAPSDGGDTPMADAGGQDEEGSGEEGSEDEDHDMERTSTPATPLRSSAAPPSTSAMDISDTPEAAPREPVAESSIIVPTETPVETPAGSLVEANTGTITEMAHPLGTTNEPSQSTEEIEGSAMKVATPKMTQEAQARNESSSPDLPLSAISHSRQSSLNRVSVPATTTDIAVPEEVPDEAPALAIEADTAPALATVSEPEVAPEPVPALAHEPVPESVPEAAPEAAPEPVQESAAKIETLPESQPQPQPEPETKLEPIQPQPDAPSPQPSEPDLMGSLEEQLKKDNDDMNRS